jgi:hypothetical protein
MALCLCRLDATFFCVDHGIARDALVAVTVCKVGMGHDTVTPLGANRIWQAVRGSEFEAWSLSLDLVMAIFAFLDSHLPITRETLPVSLIGGKPARIVPGHARKDCRHNLRAVTRTQSKLEASFPLPFRMQRTNNAPALSRCL